MGSSVSSLQASSRSLFGAPLIDVVNNGTFYDNWNFENQNSMFMGEFQVCTSGLHNYVVFTGFEVGIFFLERYLLAQTTMMDYAMERTNTVTMIDNRETIPLSFAFDLVVDSSREETALRYMSPRIYNYKEISNMNPTDSKNMFVYTMIELKQIILQTYRELGNYNLVKTDCRVFANKVLSILKSKIPVQFKIDDIWSATKSTIEKRTEKDLHNLKITEKLLVAKTFEVVEHMWGSTVRQMTELCVFECLQGRIVQPGFIDAFMVQLIKNTNNETLMFMNMISGWYKQKSSVKLPIRWDIKCTNPMISISRVSTIIEPDGTLSVTVVGRDVDPNEAYPVLPYKV